MELFNGSRPSRESPSLVAKLVVSEGLAIGGNAGAMHRASRGIGQACKNTELL